MKNVERYKSDLKALSSRGDQLLTAMEIECASEESLNNLRAKLGDKKVDEFIKKLPRVRTEYQSWYSEAKALVRQLLPDRLADFASHYETTKTRKELSIANYRIEDYLQGLQVLRPYTKEVLVGMDCAIPHLQQQLAILNAVKARFESSLFDVRQLVQADLLDSELDAAEELARNNFYRAAGAICGVVLERHLAQVCANHSLKISKKTPTIAEFNQTLKSEEVIDTPQWRHIQHLADIRNLCDHNKGVEPTADQVNDLIAGVKKVTKTLF